VFQQYPTLGRFMVRDLNQIVAVGIVKSVKRVM
jgi:translation elongation factor EF-1alpha